MLINLKIGEDVKSVLSSPCVKAIARDEEVEKENKPVLTRANTVTGGARDVFSSDSDFVSKPVPLRKVRGFSYNDDDDDNTRS